MKKINRKLYESKPYFDIKTVIQDGIIKYSDLIAFTIKNKDENNNVKYTDITYKMFEKDIEKLGTGLMDMNLKDKKIALIGPNSYEWVLSYVTILYGGGIVVPLDKGLPDQEIEDSIIRSDADAIIFDKKYIDIMKDIKEKNNTKVKHFICMTDNLDSEITNIEHVKKIGENILNNGNKDFLDIKINPDKVSIILFTSGTTSLSKAVMLTQRNIASNIYQMNASEKLYSTDVNLIMLPFHHTFGSTGILLMLNNGVHNVFCDGLRHIQENMKEYNVTVFVCVPLILEAIYKRILMEIKKQGKEKSFEKGKKLSKFLLKFGIDVRKKIFKQILNQLGGHMRFIVSGAAAIDKNVAEAYNILGILTIQGYGLTETSPVLCAENEKYIKYGSVGIPLIDVEIGIDKPNEEGIGEILAKGPNVMVGYYNNEQATKDCLIDGWYHTGDLGYIDKNGYLFITGRMKNVVVLKNGKNIFPEEIEVLINKLPYVSESLVFGYPKDDDLVLSAKIVYDEIYVKKNFNGMSEKELKEKIWEDIKKINTTVPKYKHVKNIIITDKPMIKTTTEKIKRFVEIENIKKEKQFEK